MANWAAEWANAKDVFKDATKKDKPESRTKIVAFISANRSNVASALRKVDEQFKNHEGLIKAVNEVSFKTHDKVKSQEKKVVADTDAAVKSYEESAKDYRVKLEAIIQAYKVEKASTAAKGGDPAEVKTAYIYGVKALGKQLDAISAGIGAELKAFTTACATAWKKNNVLDDGKKDDGTDVATAAAKAAVKKAIATLAKARALINSEGDTRKELVAKRFDAFDKLKTEAVRDLAHALETAAGKGVAVPHWPDMMDLRDKRWQTSAYDGVVMNKNLAGFAKSLKALEEGIGAGKKH